MKTLIINGSPRKNGDTVNLIKKVIGELEGEYKVIDAYYCGISPCIDCRFCKKNDGCAINDGMTELYGYIRECDNILIASPVYFSELTGKTLDLCSRLQMFFCAAHFRGIRLIEKKKRGAVILVGGGNGRAEKAHQTAVCLLHQMGAEQIYPLVSSLDTDNTPAADDAAAVRAACGIARYFNSGILP